MMHAVLLTDEELTQLKSLVGQQDEGCKHLEVALENPVPNLAGFLWDIDEIVSRARDGSSYIDTDFEEFLDVLGKARPAYKKAMALRKSTQSDATVDSSQ